MEIRTVISRNIAALLIAGLASMGAAQAASLYKWTDAEGNVHYSQTPPEKGNADKMVVKDSSKPAPNNSDADAEPPQDDGQDPRAAQIRKRNCEIARANLEIYKNSARIKKPDGTIVELSDEMRAAKIKEAQAMVDANCR